MIGAIRTDESAGGFEGQPDLPAQYQVPVQIPEPYFITLSGHDCPDAGRKKRSSSRPPSLLKLSVSILPEARQVFRNLAGMLISRHDHNP